MRVTRSGSANSDPGMEIRRSCKCWASVNPGSTVRNASNVRIIKPALTSSTNAIATWPTTKKFRARCRSRLAPTLRPALRRAGMLLELEYFSAGTNPNSKLDSRERAKVNPSVRASSEISFRRGRFDGPVATRKRTLAYANATPRTPPVSPSIVLSTSSPRTIRTHPAPSAARTANSCWRVSSRTSNKLVTFAQTISMTTPMVAMTIHKRSPTLPITSCFNGRIIGVIFHVS